MARLRFNAFSMNCVSHIHHGQWVRPDTRQLDYTDLGAWIELAQLLERGKFDALFLADVVGTYNSYGGDRDAAVEEGLQIPVNDPSLLIPAMALATENLGFAFTQSVLQEPPFNFARRLSTLDHITEGRVGWNIVTSYLQDAGRNLGFGGLPKHEDRYRRAEEYVTVLYKLLEGSWEDDAVVRDVARRVYADPAKIHDIDHSGEFFPDVPGPHLSEPSPQRTPVLFQAGSSDWGRDFAARNAEAIFIVARSPEAARVNIDDVRARAVRFGRDPEDIVFFQGLSFVVGGTEEEAQGKMAELEQTASHRGYAAHMGGGMGIDLSEIDLETPIGELDQYNTQGIVQGLIDTAPDKTWTFGDLLAYRSAMTIVGTPEQIADEIELWADAGVGGINVPYFTTPGSFAEFIDGVAPVLQERGLMQREYAPGTLREKLADGRAQARLGETHPGGRVRRERAAAAA
ncbi:MAG TPA: LLM class flavin-dependent oxidoreductase [Solirubrobacterales bacterium]|nr:LLM class flavin-dependent oxidoreductase [Solirubrobacterales bacterium]